MTTDDVSLHSHGLSWPAIFAGATGAAVLSLVLVLLGTGLGFAAVSPWSNSGASSAAVGISAIVWLTIVQILAAILGGYLAGRLRVRWPSIHVHEVYFRDTAHGFLAWAAATLAVATLFSSALGSVLSGGVRAGASAAGGVAATAVTAAAGAAGSAASSGANAGGSSGQSSSGSDPIGYFTDTLFRPAAGQTANAGGANTPPPTAEAGRILATSLKNGSLSQADSQYLAQLVAQRTGLSQDDAQKRVNDTFTQLQQSIEKAKADAKAAADKARKAAAGLSLWLVVSLLIGAFTASWAATFGGRLRDGLAAAAAAR